MDDGGNEPITVGVIIVIALKVVDYGWTGWDVFQDMRVLLDPCASQEDQLWARMDIILAVGLELVEPDDLLPVGTPFDDAVRRPLLGVAKQVLEKEGYEGLIRFFRKELGPEVGNQALKWLGVRTDDYVWRFKKAIGRDPLPGHDLHHGFPKAEEFAEWFAQAGIDVHAPENMFELPKEFHTLKPLGVHTNEPLGTTWERFWREYMKKNPEPIAKDLHTYLDELAESFGITEYRVRLP